MELMIDPCGMIMDYLPACSTRPFWFVWRTWDGVPLTPEQVAQGYLIDGPWIKRMVMIRWYFCPPGALPFPHDQIYASTEWLSWQEQCMVQQGEIPRYRSGERGAGPFVDGHPTVRGNHGETPLGSTGQSFCGRPEWFLGDVPDGNMARGPGGLPICCNPALGAAIGLPQIQVPQASMGLRGFNVNAALAMHGIVPAAAELGLAAVGVATDAGVGLTSIPVTLPVGPVCLASVPVPMGESLGIGPVAGNMGYVMARGTVFTWSLQIGAIATAGLCTVAVRPPSAPVIASTSVFSEHRYYYIAIVAGAGDLSLYVDANLEATAGGVFPAVPAGGWLWNTTDGGVTYLGEWSEVRVYGAALTAAEILADAQGTVQAGIVSRWPCNDGSGATVADVVGGADVTLLGGPGWTADGPGGGSVQFNGSGQYGTAADLIAVGEPITITLWYRPPRA